MHTYTKYLTQIHLSKNKIIHIIDKYNYDENMFFSTIELNKTLNFSIVSFQKT